MKFIRRLLWFVSTYFVRYRKLITISLLVSLGFLGVTAWIWPRVPHPKKTVYVGVIGDFNAQQLPPLTNKILNASLISISPTAEIVNNLAQSVTPLNEGKEYLVKLKPNLFWPDKTSLVSSDIQINIPQVKSEFPDDQTILFVLPQPFAPFPSVLDRPVLNQQGQTPTGYEVSITQTSSGDLKNIQLESAKQIVIIKTFDSQSQALTSFKLGQIDALYGLSSKPDEPVTHNIKLQEEINFRRVVSLFFNTDDPILTDQRIRQGLAYLIEDKSFANERAYSSIYPKSWAFNPLVKRYDFNSQNGTALIKENLGPDQELNLELATLPEYLSVAESIKNQLEQADVALTISVVNQPPTNFQLFLGNFDIPPDPDQYQFWHSTQATNLTGVSEAKIDKLLEDGRTNLDQKERRQIYTEFQKALAEELPVLFLYYPKEYSLFRGKLNF